MAKKRPFTLLYAPAVKKHLEGIERKYHSQIHSEIETQLAFEPERETRNRKPLERPIVARAEWELRLGPDNRFRVFYQVEAQKREVRILAIGVKEKDRLVIAGEEFEG
jgi:mRNA-degrading endonuclease RelE of RelBE toxin-antitoxin system